MKTLYFIDSENVGDSWISLLDVVSDTDEILVFYTAKSPHMNYKNLIALKESDKKISFIECHEGNNALDFQLCSELGYRICNTECCFVIVSNDTGYDAVIKYWGDKNIRVSRIKGNECGKKQVREAVPSVPENETSDNPSSSETIDDNAKEILYCIGKDKLQDLHEALQQLYGTKKATFCYNAFKSGSAYNAFLQSHPKLSLADKHKLYCSIVFDLQAPELSCPKDFPKFVIETWKKKKNLNSFRAALQTKYGNENGMRLYSVIKAHVKILDNIK